MKLIDSGSRANRTRNVRRRGDPVRLWTVRGTDGRRMEERRNRRRRLILWATLERRTRNRKSERDRNSVQPWRPTLIAATCCLFVFGSSATDHVRPRTEGVDESVIRAAAGNSLRKNKSKAWNNICLREVSHFFYAFLGCDFSGWVYDWIFSPSFALLTLGLLGYINVHASNFTRENTETVYV